MGTIALDVETNAKDPRFDRDFRVLGVSYANSEELSGYLPLGHRGMPQHGVEISMSRLRSLVECHTRFVFHNAKFDLCCLSRIGINLWESDWYDTLLMTHFVDENLPSKGLDYLGKHFFNEGKEKDENFTAFLNSFGWAFMPRWMIEPYAIQDAKLTLRLFYLLLPQFEEQGFTHEPP